MQNPKKQKKKKEPKNQQTVKRNEELEQWKMDISRPVADTERNNIQSDSIRNESASFSRKKETKKKKESRCITAGRINLDGGEGRRKDGHRVKTRYPG